MLVRRWLDEAGIHDPVLRQCYTLCARRAAGEDGGNLRWWGLRSVPAAVRPHMAAMAALGFEADLRADTGPVGQRRRTFDAYVDAALAAISAGHAADPVHHAVAHTMCASGMSTIMLTDWFDAMRRDIDFAEFATFEEVRQWARMTASGSLVGMMTLLEGADVARELEDVLDEFSVLLQWTDQLADLAEDLDNGRMYLPLADLDRFGVRAEDLKARRWMPGMAELLAFEADRVTSRMPALVAQQQRHTASALVAALHDHCTLMLHQVLSDGPALLRRPSRVPLADRLDVWLPVWRSTIPC
ncbi:phytoene/squalene synthase family protein [Streptomyces sp. NPDC086549]|uniref:phytoene/squalene synthase family protein n=1 Tax=Streptomyces sp. NPDC086549 TaxID=3365752 RepID=UPI0038233855